MTTDIKLEEHYVTVEALALKSKTWDFMLDHPSRRKSPNPEHRRALVHDHDDGLTINWAGDYPGGVSLFGGQQKSSLQLTNSVSLKGDACYMRGHDNEAVVAVGYLGPNIYLKAETVKFEAEKVSLTTKNNPNGVGGVALEHSGMDELVINPDQEFHGGVTIMGNVKIPLGELVVKNQPPANLDPGTPFLTEIDLIKEVFRLRDMVDSQEKRLKALEGI